MIVFFFFFLKKGMISLYLSYCENIMIFCYGGCGGQKILPTKLTVLDVLLLAHTINFWRWDARSTFKYPF